MRMGSNGPWLARIRPVRITARVPGDGAAAGQSMPGKRRRLEAEAGRFVGVGHGHGIGIDAALRAPASAVAALRGIPAGRSIGGGRGDGLVAARSAGARQRGFTLIEVLLATTVLAAGLALGFATLRAATASANRAEAIAQRSERIRAVEGFLRRRLASTLPVAFATDPQTGRAIRFVGEPQRVRFVADLPDYLGRGGPHLHDVALFDDGDPQRLAVSFAMVLAGETIEDRDARPPEPLAHDVTSLRFRYRGLDQQMRPTEWLERWEHADILPMQVQVEIETASGGRWPALVVALPQGGVATIPTVLP
jgi:general secretion pathway protein J